MILTFTVTSRLPEKMGLPDELGPGMDWGVLATTDVGRVLK